MPDVRIIKLGGSLLDWPPWPETLRQWRSAQRPMRDVLIAGGGAWVELMREADARFALGEQSCHWLCLRLMSVTARLAQHLLPEASLIDAWPAAQGAAGTLAIADALPLIEAAQRRPSGSGLPHSWYATSDSIAAWLAIEFNAAELVLLKSTLPPPDASFASAAAHGYVDRQFPATAAPLGTVRCVDLRSPRLAEFELRP